MVKQHSSRESFGVDAFLAGPKGDTLAFRQAIEVFTQSVPIAEALVITSLPRASLQIVQPTKISESLLRTYAREFHALDRPSWRAILDRKPAPAVECWGDGEFERSPFYVNFMQPHGFAHLLALPLTAPILIGYAGALHLYRSAEQGPFSHAEIESASNFAKALDQAAEKIRAARISPECVDDVPWSHHPAGRQFIFDSQVRPQLPESEFQQLDERLRDQILRHARQRMLHLNGHDVASDRLAMPDARGDLWTFRVVVHKTYPALGEGAFIFFCLQPDRCDWDTVRAADFPADAELSRLVPALRFMQEHFHRGPTLNEIAKTVHLSPFHFHRRFTELLGITPKHFLLECQIFQAKAQLAAGDKDLVEIARACGFAHQSHFTSRFKQATGLTPTRWRRLAAKLMKEPAES
jgi:AraC-like DNA-binding protein